MTRPISWLALALSGAVLAVFCSTGRADSVAVGSSAGGGSSSVAVGSATPGSIVIVNGQRCRVVSQGEPGQSTTIHTGPGGQLSGSTTMPNGSSVSITSGSGGSSAATSSSSSSNAGGGSTIPNCVIVKTPKAR
jgi:hypothetical protein